MWVFLEREKKMNEFNTLELQARQKGVYIDVQPAGDHGVSVVVSKGNERVVRLASGETLEDAQAKAEMLALCAFFNKEIPAQEDKKKAYHEEVAPKAEKSSNTNEEPAPKAEETSETESIFAASFFKPKGVAEAEAKAKEEEEAKRKAEEEAKRKAAEAKAREEAEAKRKAEEEAKRKAEEEAKRKAAEAEAKRKAEEEARKKAEKAAKLKEQMAAMQAELASLDNSEEEAKPEEFEVVKEEPKQVQVSEKTDGLAPEFIFNYGVHKQIPITDLFMKDPHFIVSLLMLDTENNPGIKQELIDNIEMLKPYCADRGLTKDNIVSVCKYIEDKKLAFNTDSIKEALSA